MSSPPPLGPWDKGQMRLPKFRPCEDGLDRANIGVDFQLTLPEMSWVLANRIFECGVYLNNGVKVPYSKIPSTERLAISRTLEIIRQALQEKGFIYVVPHPKTPHTLYLWATHQIVNALLPSLRAD